MSQNNSCSSCAILLHETELLLKNAICGTLLTDLTSKKLTLGQLSLQDQPSIINTVTGTLSFTDMILENAPHDGLSWVAGLSAGAQHPDPLTACAFLEDAPHDGLSWVAGLSAGAQHPDPLTACAFLEDAPHDGLSWVAGLSAGAQHPDLSPLITDLAPKVTHHEWFPWITNPSVEDQRSVLYQPFMNTLSKDIGAVTSADGISNKRVDLVEQAAAEPRNKKLNEADSEKGTKKIVAVFVKKYFNYTTASLFHKMATDVIVPFFQILQQFSG